MGQDPQADFPILAVIITRTEGGAQVAFEHAEDGLRLPTLTVKDFREVRLHQAAIVTADRMGLAVGAGTAAIGGRNDTANIPGVTEAMEAFRLLAGIAQQGPQRLVGQGLADRRTGFREIGLGAAVNRTTQDEMVGRIADRRKLGIAAFIAMIRSKAKESARWQPQAKLGDGIPRQSSQRQALRA